MCVCVTSGSNDNHVLHELSHERLNIRSNWRSLWSELSQINVTLKCALRCSSYWNFLLSFIRNLTNLVSSAIKIYNRFQYELEHFSSDWLQIKSPSYPLSTSILKLITPSNLLKEQPLSQKMISLKSAWFPTLRRHIRRDSGEASVSVQGFMNGVMWITADTSKVSVYSPSVMGWGQKNNGERVKLHESRVQCLWKWILQKWCPPRARHALGKTVLSGASEWCHTFERAASAGKETNKRGLWGALMSCPWPWCKSDTFQ